MYLNFDVNVLKYNIFPSMDYGVSQEKQEFS